MTGEETFGALDLHFAELIGKLSGVFCPELELAALLVSRQRTGGHICLPIRDIAGQPLPAVYSGLEIAPEADDWIEKLQRTDVVGVPGEFKPLILDERGRLYLRRYWEYEKRLGDIIKERVSAARPPVQVKLLRQGLARFFPDEGDTNWQKVAAFTAVLSNFCVITGGPGTGKTRTVAAILALLLEQAGQERLRIALTAPSGKAAARLKESVQTAKATLNCPEQIKGLLPTEATTIHRLLGTIPDSPYFRHDTDHRLVTDVLVVDEASMVDLALMSKLFQATPDNARIILLGDKDQLTSVEAGYVLGDICNTGAASQLSKEFGKLYAASAGETLTVKMRPQENAIQDTIVELQRNYRFKSDGGIFRLSRAINTGDVEIAFKILRNDSHRDISWRRSPPTRSLPAAVRERVTGGYHRYLQTDEPAEALARFDEFQILCALRNGPYGVGELNRLAEQSLLEARLLKRDGQWYRGRPVMITRNDYNLKLFNGDIGLVLPEASGELRVFFANANGEIRKFPPSRLPAHETVFAMTIHKSQGSEFGAVLLVLPTEDAPILTRELIYTGLTRARDRVEIWSPESILRAALLKRTSRTSGLRDALWNKPKDAQLLMPFAD
jgi:exodeoxyribonuclease V alpha subunit